MKGYQLSILFLSVAMAACSVKSGRDGGDDAGGSAESPCTVSIDINKAVPMDEVLASDEIITFDENVENIMGIPQNITVKGDTIFVVDPYKAPGIYAYLKNGKQLFAYSNQGNGPGCVNSPSCISVCDTAVSTFDTSTFKIVVLDKAGNYRCSKDVPVMVSNAMLDAKGNIWADYTNQDYDPVRVAYSAATDTVYRMVLRVPELLKGMTQIGIEPLQQLPDGSIGYTPAFEPRIYTLSDGEANVRYELDFCGLWPGDDSFREKFTGNAWAQKVGNFPVKSIRFHESNRYFALRFKNMKDMYLHLLDKTTGIGKTLKIDTETYSGSVYLAGDEIYFQRMDDRMEIMKIKAMD